MEQCYLVAGHVLTCELRYHHVKRCCKKKLIDADGSVFGASISHLTEKKDREKISFLSTCFSR